MTTENTPETAPGAFDPADVERQVEVLSKKLDDLETDPILRPLHDFLQDDLIRVVREVQKEVGTLAYFMSVHEERIQAIEMEESSQLLREDAQPLIEYIEKAVLVFRSMKKIKEAPSGLDALITDGEELIRFINEITLPEEDDEID